MRLTPAIVAALIVLAASFALSVGFVVANGGMSLQGLGTAGGASASPAIAPSQSAAVEGQAATPTPAPATPAPTAPATPSPTAEATAEPTATATATPAPTVTASPSPPVSDRYELLTPCGDELNCWIYVVREGDNLTSIANYFGVSLASVYERNPWAETTPLVAGQELRLPPPTR